MKHQVDNSLPKGDIDVKMIDFGTAQLCKDGCSVAEGISGTPGVLMPRPTALLLSTADELRALWLSQHRQAAHSTQQALPYPQVLTGSSHQTHSCVIISAENADAYSCLVMLPVPCAHSLTLHTACLPAPLLLLPPLALTAVFLAPEVTIQHRCSIGMDVWAAGAMLYLMLTGRYPLWDVPAKDFKLTSMKKAVATIQAGQVFWDIPQVQALSPSCQELLRGMLAADPAQRVTVHQALEHPWLQEQLGSGYTPLQKQQQ
jgi:serine/threonine protein kinase